MRIDILKFLDSEATHARCVADKECTLEDETHAVEMDQALRDAMVLVTALRRIANHPANITGAQAMEKIARDALKEAGL